MGFGQAVSTCFQKYVTFSGRARRSEFWWWQLFVILLGAIANIGDSVFGLHYTNSSSAAQVGWLGTVVALALVLPSIAVLFRRLHDTGRSGWWLLIGLIPILGTIVLIWFCVQDSQPGSNSYGANPKEGAPAAA